MSTGTGFTGLDLSHEMALQSCERLPESDITQEDAEEIPFDYGAFDAVRCRMSIQHHPHREKSVAQMYQILENNGTVS